MLKEAKLTLVVLGLSATGGAFAAADVAPTPQAKQTRLAFEVGVQPGGTHYTARGRGYGVFLTPGEVRLALSRPEDDSARILGLTLVGADRDAAAAASEQLPGKSNHFKGASPSNWRVSVAQYGRVTYRGVYPGIDLTYYGSDGQLEYDFVLSPHADPSAIRLRVSGADAVVAKPEGLTLSLGDRTIIQRQPVLYQESGGRREPVNGEYVVYADGDVGFKLGPYDSSQPLVIDPVILSYSTYFGGTSDDRGFGVAADTSGNAYVVGYTISSDFPTTGGSYVFDRDVVVAEFNPTGGLVYSTIIGGSFVAGRDEGHAIAVDSTTGEAYVTGYTASSDFPTSNVIVPGQKTAYQSFQAGNRDAFLVKLDPTGFIEYSTFLGGFGEDRGQGVAADGTGKAYVSGFTDTVSPFPITAATAVQAAPGGGFDAFLTVLDTTVNGAAGLVYSTYLGGSGTDVSSGVAQLSGIAYLTGYTQSTDFPTVSAAQPTFGGGDDAFVAEIFPTIPGPFGVIYSTYLGGALGDDGNSIAVDSSGNAYVTGRAFSFDFPTVSPLQASKGAPTTWDAFVTKLNSSGSLVYSTYIGGTSNEYGQGIAADASGAAYVVGQTGSTDFPTANPAQAAFGGGIWDAFALKLNPAGSAVVYSTYLGGTGIDQANGVAVDPSLGAYVVGLTASADFPTVNAWYGVFQGGANDLFLTKISPPTITVTSPNGGDTWAIGSTKTIAWSNNIGAGETVKIEINRSYSGGVWEEIAAAAPNTTSSFDWAVTGPATTNARMRITWTADSSVTDESDADFTVAAPSLTVTSPNTATNWAIGSTQQITWSHNLGATETVKIEVSRNGGSTWSPIASPVTNATDTTGVYPWVVTGGSTNTARVRVTWNNVAATNDMSDVNFSIVAPFINITAPLTGVNWGIGSTQTISWAHNLGTGETVTIQLSTDGGLTFPTTIVGPVANNGATTGTYSWTVSGPASTTARIKVTWSAAPTSGTSANFTIATAFIATGPSAGAQWGIGSTHAITWNSNVGSGATVKIELSRDGGANFSPLTASTPNTGSYNWTVTGPTTTSGNARMRLSWNEGVAVGTSAAFTIANPVVVVTVPNTAVSWKIGTTQNVVWVHNLGTLETVKIEINRSFPGGSWDPIASPVTNTAVTNGFYSWVVSGPISAAARIRVTWNANPAVTDVSNVNFNIIP